MQMKPVIVIGGGWSFKPYFEEDLRGRGTVIGVNDAAVHTQVHIACTMDRLWLEGRRETMDFLAIPTHYREGTCKNGDPPHMGLSYKNNNLMEQGMSLEPHTLYGNNSGAVAINLAYKVALAERSKQIYLLGFDMQNGPKGEKHWYPPYPWSGGGGTSDKRFTEWNSQFKPWADQFAAAGFDIKNVTSRSMLNVWKKISFEQFKKETGDV